MVNVGIVQSGWIYAVAPVQGGAQHLFNVFRNGANFEIRISQIGQRGITLFVGESNVTVHQGNEEIWASAPSPFYAVIVPEGISNVWVSEADWIVRGANAGDRMIFLNNGGTGNLRFTYNGAVFTKPVVFDGSCLFNFGGFSFDIFNNGPGGTPSRANPGLAASGTIRMWTQVNGVNTRIQNAALTLTAVLPCGADAMEFVTINRIWNELGLTPFIDVNKNGSWDRIYLTATYFGQRTEVVLVNSRFFNLDLFNNGPAGTASRPNTGLAANGTIRMWPQLAGVNARIPLAAADTIIAVDQAGNCVMNYVRIGRVWEAGTGWLNYFNMIDVDRNAEWVFIYFTITVFGQTLTAVLHNGEACPETGKYPCECPTYVYGCDCEYPEFCEDCAPEGILILRVNPAVIVAQQGETVEITVTTRNAPDGTWIGVSNFWLGGVYVQTTGRLYVVNNQVTFTLAIAENAQVGPHKKAVYARIMGDWSQTTLLDYRNFVLVIEAAE
jgi:DNA-binding beta-propeller fold protein YncE